MIALSQHRPLLDGLDDLGVDREPAGGQAADIAIAAKEILRWRRTLNEVIAKHTGKTAEQVEKDSDRDYYMSAAEAQAYGIVDHVYTSPRDVKPLPVPSAA